MKKILIFVNLLFIFVFCGPLSSASSEDYFGFLHYTPHFNVTYLFYIDSNNNIISFKGINETNSDQYVEFSLDSSNSFLQRLNYVWYYGFFNETHLSVNSYVPAEIFYVENFTQIGPLVYSSYFSLNSSFFNFGNSSFNLTLDLNNNLSKIDSFSSFLNSSVSSLISIPNFLVAAHLYEQGIIETKFVPNSTSLEVHLWIKEDLFRNGLGPQWINQIYPIRNISLDLISPPNGKIFETSSNIAEVNFGFYINNSSFQGYSCFVEVIGQNYSYLLNSTINSSLFGLATSNFSLGTYNWYVLCKLGNVNWISSNNSFMIRDNFVETLPIKLKSKSEEGGRRKVLVLPLQNLSINNSSTIQPNSFNKSAISLITAAAVGALGDKGAIGFGVLLIILGIIGLLLYNRERLGLVKITKT